MSDTEFASKIRGAIGRGQKDDDHILDLLAGNPDLLDASGRTPLHHAAIWNRLTLLEKLIAMGASLSHADLDGRTPLHFAIQERNHPAARMLLAAGAEVDAKDNHGNTPLWGAVGQFQEFEETIKLLLAFGASPDSKNIYGKSPRDLAVSQKVGTAAEWLTRYAKV